MPSCRYMLIRMLFNLHKQTWHPIMYAEYPLPGNNNDLFRYKSTGHHTAGFPKREDAMADVEACKTKLESMQNTVTLDCEEDIAWDGEAIPVDVELRLPPKEFKPAGNPDTWREEFILPSTETISSAKDKPIGDYVRYRPVGLEGFPVEKTKDKWPYTYDFFVIWRGGKNHEINDSCYSDRIRQWDHDKYHQLQIKHFGGSSDWFNSRTPAQIEAWLRDYCDKPNLRLIVVMEGCNVSSGYPLWHFSFNTGEDKYYVEVVDHFPEDGPFYMQFVARRIRRQLRHTRKPMIRRAFRKLH